MPEGALDHLNLDIKRRARTQRLPDQLDIKFGRLEAIGRYVLRADRKLREHGIRVSICTDFDEFIETNQRKRSRDWYSPMPCFLTKYSTLDERNAFWLKGVNGLGETVLAHAIRLYVWPHSTLKEEVESLRVMYDEIPYGPEARGRATAPTAAKMSGRVCVMGGLWLDPDYRGGKLAATISPLTRTVALSQWMPDYCCSFVFQTGVDKGRAALYGWPAQNIERKIHFSNLVGFDGPELDCSLCYRTTEEIEEVVLAGAGLSEREIELSDIVPLPASGMATQGAQPMGSAAE